MSKHYQFIAVRREVDQDVVVVVKAADTFVFKTHDGSFQPFLNLPDRFRVTSLMANS